MHKITARKNALTGNWVDDFTGKKVEPGLAGVVYVYCGRPEASKRTTSTVSQSRPHVSHNMAVHADQAPTFNKESGPGVHYDSRGVMHSTSYAAREREARRRGKSFG